MKKQPIPLVAQIVAAGLPAPKEDYRFLPVRKYEMDLAWPGLRLGVEIQGGVWSKPGAKRCPACGQLPRGAHGTGAGIVRDIEKFNLATMTGWRLLLVTPKMVQSGAALALVRQAVVLAGWKKNGGEA